MTRGAHARFGRRRRRRNRLLLWANVTGIALLAGVAVAAQIEAVRAGHADPLLADSDDDGIPDGQAHAAPR
jgi:hypothetical protein